MLIKLGIIAGIVILGGMIFSTEIGNIFPTTSATVFDSFMDDVTNFGTTASDSVDQRIDESMGQIVDKTGNSITNANKIRHNSWNCDLGRHDILHRNW